MINILEQNIEKTLFIGLLHNDNVFKSPILFKYIEERIRKPSEISILIRNKSFIELMLNDMIILKILSNNTDIDWEVVIKYLEINSSNQNYWI
jgi:hypothetical protein